MSNPSNDELIDQLMNKQGLPQTKAPEINQRNFIKIDAPDKEVFTMGRHLLMALIAAGTVLTALHMVGGIAVALSDNETKKFSEVVKLVEAHRAL
jgi:hypothetical protein